MGRFEGARNFWSPLDVSLFRDTVARPAARPALIHLPCVASAPLKEIWGQGARRPRRAAVGPSEGLTDLCRGYNCLSPPYWRVKPSTVFLSCRWFLRIVRVCFFQACLGHLLRNLLLRALFCDKKEKVARSGDFRLLPAP